MLEKLNGSMLRLMFPVLSKYCLPTNFVIQAMLKLSIGIHSKPMLPVTFGEKDMSVF